MFISGIRLRQKWFGKARSVPAPPASLSSSLGVEGGVPTYQYLNGLQMKNTWQLNGGFQAMF